MSVSEAKKKGNRKWDSNNIKTLSIRLRNNDPIFELIDKAIQKTGMNKVDYIRCALYSRFIQDGIMKNADQDEEFNEANSSSGLDE